MGSSRDVVIVGGGHNGLVAAAYLAGAGLSVTVLERLDHVGGAAVSEFAFEGVEARLSRYSYLVSLLPQRIIRDLKLDLRLVRRRYSSYTPLPGSALPGSGTGLLVDNNDRAATDASFNSIGAAKDADAWRAFYDATSRLAEVVFPTMTEPLLTRSELRAKARPAVGKKFLTDMIDRPIGHLIERRFENDLVRGVVLTDALIGTFTSANDMSLAANRGFLYHLIGGGTGDWDVPVGGMGAVTSALENAARTAGATILTGAEVTAVTPDGEVRFIRRGREQAIGATRVLANVAPTVLSRLLGETPVSAKPEGAQVKVNLLLSRLPRLLDPSVDPAAAFGGTFHINEGYGQLEDAYLRARDGRIPNPLPAEVYCHSLTDPSILSPELQASGAQTLTVFGLHAPDRLLSAETNDARRGELQRAVLASLNSVLAEPIDGLIMTDAAGAPCIETKTTRDLDEALALPGGNIFHGPLDWPFVEDDAALGTAAERWGVETRHDRILLCGAGARRGGGVSGIGGQNAAMAVLEAG
ncbi:NAD(P)/FAD-dependent oxidoreductase [soil metagenome]